MKELAGWVMDERGWACSPDGAASVRFDADGDLEVVIQALHEGEPCFIPRAVIDALIAAGKP